MAAPSVTSLERRAPGPRASAPGTGIAYRRRRETEITRREHEVPGPVAVGRTTPGIADALGLTRNTVKTYQQAAMRKLGARNRAEAVARAVEARLL